MAGASAASLLSLTISTAAVTIVAVGGILAGPSLLDCSRQGGSIGACLRGKLDGLARREPAPPLGQPGAARGLIDAKSAEFSPPTFAVAELTAAPGAMSAMVSSPQMQTDFAVSLTAPRGSVSVSAIYTVPADDTPVSLVPFLGHLEASGREPTATADTLVALAREPGTLMVTSLRPAPTAPLGRIELRAPVGQIVVGTPVIVPIAPSVAELSPNTGSVFAMARPQAAGDEWSAITLRPSPQPDLAGSIGPGASTETVVTLKADLTPPPPLPAPAGPIAEAPLGSNSAAGDVLLLPPAASGENSSFARLQLN